MAGVATTNVVALHTLNPNPRFTTSRALHSKCKPYLRLQTKNRGSHIVACNPSESSTAEVIMPNRSVSSFKFCRSK